MSWDKAFVRQALLAYLRQELAAILLAAETARDGATHEDAVAKSKYDTHGLELSYLAGSQFERARQLEVQIAQLSRQEFPAFAPTETVDIGALIEVRPPTQKNPLCFLLSNWGAGSILKLAERQLQVISSESPLGEALIGLGLGDRFELADRRGQQWELISLC